MEAALYHPEFGYYTSARNPIGREGDFYTSSDLDPVFGKLLARKFSQMASALGIAPEKLHDSRTWRGPRSPRPRILKHQRFGYSILERSASMRERQREQLEGFDIDWVDDLPSSFTGCIFSK
jgi:SAM-dependent MidA family methyltransferase